MKRGATRRRHGLAPGTNLWGRISSLGLDGLARGAGSLLLVAPRGAMSSDRYCQRHYDMCEGGEGTYWRDAQPLIPSPPLPSGLSCRRTRAGFCAVEAEAEGTSVRVNRKCARCASTRRISWARSTSSRSCWVAARSTDSSRSSSSSGRVSSARKPGNEVSGCPKSSSDSSPTPVAAASAVASGGVDGAASVRGETRVLPRGRYSWDTLQSASCAFGV